MTIDVEQCLLVEIKNPDDLYLFQSLTSFLCHSVLFMYTCLTLTLRD